MNQQQIPKWTVVSQQETARPTTGGQVVRGLLVTFQLAGGPSGTVFIPDNMITADYVRAAIAEKAATLNAISNLQG